MSPCCFSLAKTNLNTEGKNIIFKIQSGLPAQHFSDKDYIDGPTDALLFFPTYPWIRFSYHASRTNNFYT